TCSSTRGRICTRLETMPELSRSSMASTSAAMPAPRRTLGRALRHSSRCADAHKAGRCSSDCRCARLRPRGVGAGSESALPSPAHDIEDRNHLECMALTQREKYEIGAANASGRTPVLFVHGLWLRAGSWKPW